MTEFYFTGKPCKHGHIAYRYKYGNCVQCSKESSRKWATDNPEKRREVARNSRRRIYAANRIEINKRLRGDLLHRERHRQQSLLKNRRERAAYRLLAEMLGGKDNLNRLLDERIIT